MKLVQLYFFGVLFFTLQTSEAFAQIPTDSLKLHLKADVGITSSGDSVSTWADQSGNGNNAIQNTLSRRPLFVASSLNGEPVIRFNGSNTFLTLPTASDLGIQSNDYEVFIVSRSASVNTNTEFLLGGALERYELHLNGSAGARFIPKASTYIDQGAIGDYSDTNAHLYNLRATNTYGSVTVDFSNTTQSNVDAQSSDSGNLYLGIRFNNSLALDGDIAEVLIYNSVLSDNARDSVESYLNGKYIIDSSAGSISITSTSFETNEASSALFTTIVDAPFSTSYRVLWGTSSTVFTDSTTLTAGGSGASLDSLSFDVTGLSANTLYYAKVKAISDYETVTSSALPLYVQHAQVTSDSLSLWLAADIGFNSKSNGDTLSLWLDISGNGNNAYVPSSNDKPTLATNSINGLPVINLGNAGAFDLPTTGELGIHNSDYEIFAVARKNGTDGLSLLGGYANFSFSLDHNGYAFRFTDFDDAESGDISVGSEGTYSDDNPYVFNIRGTDETGYVNIDYETVGSDTSNSFWMRNDRKIGLGAALINGSRFNYFKGEIAEVIIYRRSLTAAERHLVHAYLSDKYALDLPISTPTQSVSDVTFSSFGAGTAKITFSPGNGVNNLVLLKEGSEVDEIPMDSTSYSFSNIFGEGSEIGTGNYVISSSADTSVIISGLTQGLTYHAQVFSYNGEPGSGFEKYLTTDLDTASLAIPVVISVNSVSPAPFSNTSSLTTSIEVIFSGAIDTSTFGADSSFIVRGSESGYHSGVFVFSESDSKVMFTPDSSFKAGELVSVNLTNKLSGSAGKEFGDAQGFSFNTRTSASTASFQKSGSLEQGFNASKTLVYDLNSDGWSDILSVNQDSYSISVWYGDSDSTYAEKEDFSATDIPTNIAVADMDGDGDEDILITDSDGYSFKILANDGDSGFDFGTNHSLNNYSYSVSTGDLDHDGDLDVVVGIYDYVSVLVNDGTGTLSSPTDYFIDANENVTEVVVSDIDDDGDLDIIAVDYYNQFYSLISNGDGTFESPISYTSVDYPSSIAIGDVDNDGDVDLAISSNDTYYFHIYKNNGDGTFATEVEYGTDVYIEDLKLVDYDGDGDLDIIGHENGNDIQLYPNSGDGTFPSHTTLYIDDSVYSFALSDKDDDGDVDLFVSTYDSLYIYENTSFDPNIITGTEGWRLVSSPLGNTSFSDLLPGIWTQGFTGATSTSGASNVYLWDETSSNEDTTNWISPTSISNSLRMGAGALVYVYSDNNGPLVAGDAGFPKTLAYSGYYLPNTGNDYIELDSLLNQNEDGWTLLGNPFFFEIDWDDFSRYDLSESVYVWNADSSDWDEWNGDSGDLTNGIINAYTGFFVQSLSDEPEIDIDIPSGYDGLSGSSSSSEEDKIIARQIVSFPIHLEHESGLSDNSWFQFSEEAKIELDGKDAHNLVPLSASYVSFGSLLVDGTSLSINNQPFGEETYEYPLSLNSTESGKYQISIEQLSIPEGWKVQLKDNQEGIEMDLSKPYEFTMEGTSARAKISLHAAPKIQTVEKKKGSTRFVLYVSSNGFEDVSLLPQTVELDQNYPNPFNPSSIIQFGVPELSKVRLEVFDILGRKVATLLNNETRQAGRYNVQFNAGNLASGMYVYRLQVGNSILTKKMTLIK